MAAALPVIMAYAAPPANDNFANATIVSSLPYNPPTQSVLESTVETAGGEPMPSCSVPVQSTVWYAFTPSQSGVVKINTVGSTYDTVAAIFTGNSLNFLTQVACNDDTAGLLTSAVQFPATSGTTYLIQIGSVDSVPGNLSLSMVWGTTPANDDFANAITVSPLPYTDIKNTIVATTETGERLDCTGLVIGRTVWYNFTPSETVTVTVDTLGSDFDTVLAVYTGPDVSTATQLTCNDDASVATTTSQVQFLGAPATIYRTQVGGFNGESGNMTVHVSQQAVVTDTPTPIP